MSCLGNTSLNKQKPDYLLLCEKEIVNVLSVDSALKYSNQVTNFKIKFEV